LRGRRAADIVDSNWFAHSIVAGILHWRARDARAGSEWRLCGEAGRPL